ncbi:patatin-like phospholipase family protein [Denitromonas iodatirespirans]|uniref:Patatin-like phospholipase family protein n=1 Tax=Denitromonas iodatirespirans TaxID=2795389 RepID=A0A944DCL6_DENI1|nr:patatin-like phospholipase family protein [Denitromonas iodatirespirans]MBT0960273.1 patatin-like phospholipase family protein [Denitromonas iodatirespirans]
MSPTMEIVRPHQTVLILQGGGALGAYQGGVFEALHDAGKDPDWVIGTSIGSINAALIAGNRPARRLEHLYEFWARMGQGHFDLPGEASLGDGLASLFGPWRALATMTAGLPNFFAPRWWQGFCAGLTVPPASAGIYDTTPLRRTLEELVDFDYLKHSPIRLSVGAVDVESGQIRYFDSRLEAIGPEHIMASGALPPAFAPVAIDGRHYWDGGIHSNTPLEHMLRDNPRRHSLCFLATLWPLADTAPTTLADVLRRAKELRYASRADTLLGLEQELHRLRHSVSLLAERLPEAARADAEVAEAIRLGCRSTYHVVRLQAPRLEREDQAKDIDFAPARVRERWRAGCRDAQRALAARPWEEPVAAEEGVVLHDFGPAADASPAGTPQEPGVAARNTGIPTL